MANLRRHRLAASGQAARGRGRKGAAMSVHRPGRPVLHAALIAAAAVAGAADAQEERPAEIIAAQIRTQGFRCDKALGAERVSHAPNETVWLLRCGNATYRVRLTPDMAAQVERVE